MVVLDGHLLNLTYLYIRISAACLSSISIYVYNRFDLRRVRATSLANLRASRRHVVLERSFSRDRTLIELMIVDGGTESIIKSIDK